MLWEEPGHLQKVPLGLAAALTSHPVAFWPEGPGVTPRATIPLPGHLRALASSRPAPYIVIAPFSFSVPPQPPTSPHRRTFSRKHFLWHAGSSLPGKASPGGPGTAGLVAGTQLGPDLKPALMPPLAFLCPRRVHTHPHPTETAGHAEETQ